MKILRKLCSSGLLIGLFAGGAYALPEGASVQAGSVNVSSNGNTQTIHQLSDRAIINWNGFNIDIGELVHFVQPSSLSAILNRVVGQDPSMILGAMQANGQVFLINPNGVIFGHSANIDVGSLVVSTLNITDQDFMAGRLTFQQQADRDLAAVINHGTIKIDDNGFLVLTGPMVANDGVILARVGQVAMAAGTKTTVSFDPTGMIQLELPSDANTGDGIVSLSHEDAGNILAGVVNTPNHQAGQIVVRDGRTFLEVESGTLVQAGQIRVDGRAGEDAGRILLDSTSSTLLTEHSLLSASGVGNHSSGGEVYVLSDGVGASELGSVIDVRGGTSGDGGLVEQSADSGYVGVQVRASATDGERGTFLIDPERIVVRNVFPPGEAPAGFMYVSEQILEIADADILLTTEDGVDFEALNDGSLLLMNDIDLEMLLTREVGDNGPAVTFANTSDRIILQGDGGFSLTNPAPTNAENLKVVTDSGDIDINLDGGGALTGNSSLTSRNGRIDANVSGDLVVVSSSSNGEDAVRLGSIAAENLFASGDDFLVAGFVEASDSIDIEAGSISNGEGILVAPTLDLRAPQIGGRFELWVSTNNLNMTGESVNISVDEFLLPLTSVIATNSSVEGAFTNIVLEGEVGRNLLLDQSGMISIDSQGYDMSYNFIGSRTLDVIASDLNLNTPSGNITGTIAVAENLDIQADDVTLAITGPISATLSGTARDGSFNVTQGDNFDLDIDLAASESIGVNVESVFSIPITGSADAPFVILGGSTVGDSQDPFDLGSTVEFLEVYFDDGAYLSGNSSSLEVYAQGGSFEDSDLELRNDGGALVLDFVEAGDIALTASGSVEGFLAGSSASIQGNSVDVVSRLFEVEAAATNNINIDIQPFFSPTVVSAVSQSGDVTITELEGESEGQSGGVLTGRVEGRNIVISAPNSFIETSFDDPESQLVGQSITLTGGSGGGQREGPAIVANVNSPTLVANADGRVVINSLGQNLNITSNANDVTIEGINIDAVLSEAFNISATGTGDVSVLSQNDFTEFVAIQAGNTASFTTPNSLGSLDILEGTNLVLDVGGELNESLSATGFVQVVADSVELDVTAGQVIATARQGDVNLTGTNANIAVAANSLNGDVAVNMTGNMTHNAISGNMVSVAAVGGDVAQGTGRVSGDFVNLSGNNVTAQTTTGDLTVNLGSGGNATIGNDSASLSATVSGSGTVDVSNTGSLSGNYTAGSLKLSGESVNATISANTVEGDATTGDVALNSSASNELRVTNSSAPGGAFTLNHGGDVVFDTINAQNVTINTTGDITDVANTIVAQGITLNGNNIFVNTQGQVIVINAQGDVSVTNTVVDVSALTIDAQGNVGFGTSGNLAIAQVAGGQLVQLTAGGNISAGPGSFVNGFDVQVLAGGTITPDLGSPLQIGATNSILVQAQGANIAGALQGQLAPDAVTIEAPSGPIYYNGLLLNGAPVVPPEVPPELPPEVPPTVPPLLNDVENQIGQTQGQVVDDGSTGSAANDGLVEESPTQKLVAQLTEAAGGSGGGSGPTTEVLITLEIDQLGEVQVELSQPSPFDQAITGDENMSADDILDLDTEELTEVEVSLYYDAANDQILMAVNLSADDVLDLDVSEYELIPVDISYQITGDPALMIETLRANDIIDLQVEELGEIPIKVHVSGGEDVSSDE